MSDAGARTLARAEIVAIGTELVSSPKPETNSLFIAERLNEIGIEVAAKVVVRDELDDVVAVFRQALERSDVVIATGGLGPTDDDLTRLAIARVLDLPLDEDPRIVADLRERFAKRRLPMPAINLRQAQVLRGAEVLPNPQGSAPGQWIAVKSQRVALLPGPPREMTPMLVDHVLPRLRELGGRHRLFKRLVRVAGGESAVEERVRALFGEWRRSAVPIACTTLAAFGSVELHLTTRSDDAAAAEEALDRAVDELRERLGDDVYSTAGETIEEVVGRQLLARGWRVALAESCTAGAVTARLVNVPGSSAYVDCAAVTYSNRAKSDMLGVPPETIAAHGAVSEPVAAAMAVGIRDRAGVDVGVAITGIAGPGGGTPEKPVGTVVVAIAAPGADTLVKTLTLPGGRAQVRHVTTQSTLDLLRRVLGSAGSR
ncbi:MAG: competence/damage-inducible protein A [Vicinamibacterales bacterium]